MLRAAMKATCGFTLVLVIAALAGAADAARPAQSVFDVTIRATITKDWNAAVQSTEDGCTVVRRSIGHRTVTLRSSRPTRISVTLRSGKASFSPSAVRFVTAKVAQSGENSTRKEPCGSGTVRERCRPVSRRVEGRSFRFDAFRGRFVVVALIFTRCPSICPKLVTQLKAADRGLAPAARERVRYLLVSIDPEHDTVERLREYRARMALERERFALVRGAPDDVRALAASLGFGYETASGALPTHSKLVTLLDPEGRVALQRADLGTEPDALATALARPSLANGARR